MVPVSVAGWLGKFAVAVMLGPTRRAWAMRLSVPNGMHWSKRNKP
jgi:hypothetical protein